MWGWQWDSQEMLRICFDFACGKQSKTIRLLATHFAIMSAPDLGGRIVLVVSLGSSYQSTQTSPPNEPSQKRPPGGGRALTFLQNDGSNNRASVYWAGVELVVCRQNCSFAHS